MTEAQFDRNQALGQGSNPSSRETLGLFVVFGVHALRSPVLNYDVEVEVVDV
jgi:hypothetical protein